MDTNQTAHTHFVPGSQPNTVSSEPLTETSTQPDILWLVDEVKCESLVFSFTLDAGIIP